MKYQFTSSNRQLLNAYTQKFQQKIKIYDTVPQPNAQAQNPDGNNCVSPSETSHDSRAINPPELIAAL